MTPLDIWLLWCMFIVALAMIEYAILLTIRYGKLSKVDVSGKGMDKTGREKKCKKIDRYALMFFMAINLMTIGTYFYVYY